MSEFIYPNTTPVVYLDCETAFNALTDKEKFYAHYLSKASQYGGLIVLAQTSPESPLIYVLFQKIFRLQTVSELKNIALSECKLTEDDFTAFVIYASAVYANMGNYKGFGDTKIVPNLSKENFLKLVLASKAAAEQPKKIQELINNCVDKIFSLDEGEKQLGFHELGVTTYFSKNITKDDMELVKNFMIEKNIGGYNTRCFKQVDESGSVNFEIRLSSVARTEDSDKCESLGQYTFNDVKFTVTRGDFGGLLSGVNKYLQKAKEYSANTNEEKMIENYIASFQTGSLNAHKDGSRYWVKDVGPIIENYIGFIETYRDPAGTRGEFEGFVAMVNKPMSKKFAQLVTEAEKFLPMLPWPSTFEKDKFLQPDFTSLDVLTFSGSGVPAGINIPNYDEIKQNEGFKNVSLGNVLPAQYKGTVPNYLSQSDIELMEKHKINSFELQVGLHELLGHGSGKLFYKHQDGKYNYDHETVLDLETGEKISSWYKDGETYDSVFTSMGSALEECRAECVGLYLCTIPEILKIFSFEGTEADDVVYANWLSEIHSGIEGLQTYKPKTKSWLQAHCQARHAILRCMLEAGEDFVKLEEVTGKDGKPDLLLTVDRSKILSVGRPALGKFLQRIQLYRSTANVTKAKEMFDHYTEVNSNSPHPMLKYLDIVMARKKPRKLMVQVNTNVEGEKVVLKTYEASLEGMIQSWRERFENPEELDTVLEELWHKEQPHFA